MLDPLPRLAPGASLRSSFAWPLLLIVLATSTSSSCSRNTEAVVSAYAQSDSPENLQGLLKTIVAANQAGDHQKAAALTRGLIPDQAAIAKALKDGAPAEVVDGVVAIGKTLSADDSKVAGAITPGQPNRTEIKVHGATTEEIAKYEKGGVAFAEFPGGARKLAEQALRPGCKFYEVEFLEPGKDDGMKYHLFFFDGARWRMLGPAWRGVK